MSQLKLLVFTLMAVMLLAAMPCAAAPVNDTSLRHPHVEKRFVKAWIDRKIINPIVDKQIAPIIRTQVLTSVQAAKPDILDEIPAAFRGTLAEILGVAPIAGNEAKCGWLQPLCNAILRPLDRIVVEVKQRARVEVDRVLQNSTVRCTEAAIRGIKKQLFLDASSKDALLGKRWLKGWYHGKINHFMSNVMAEIRPEVHAIFVDETNRYLSALPAILQSNINKFLPDSLKPTSSDLGSRPSKRGVMDAIRRKVREWESRIVSRVHKTIEDVMLGLEDTVMETIRKAARKAVAEKLPFYEVDDAKFKN
ncbi:hypothetical protein BCR44DRAFT_25910 [Catenaria anguillulae PL171]|uniref:Root hair defective 3 GTP-binding protein-domain-containing protein n=1 Tax=Catenaria anguillulae PL171 TaxID=765915 RepID=A0A1Y2H9X7_9FUNG|nr:hypothetical protein BCR44DRAFT_25910 [Catenaria anguillulae PL171]